MDNQKFCQSCTMPIDNASDRGTEKDGTLSELYCKYCYENGAFKDPDMTVEKMKAMITTQMKKQKLPDTILHRSLALLPFLKRWATMPQKIANS